MTGIVHQAEEGCFVLEQNGLRNHVDYEECDGGILEVTHTYVHPELRGHGLAESLLKAISDYALNHGKKIRPVCSYAVVFYKRHREYGEVLADESDLDGGGACRFNAR